MIRGIVFDMDGLMFDTERLARQGWAYAGRQIGRDIPDALLFKVVGLDAEGSKRVFLDALGPEIDFAAFRKARLNYAKNQIEQYGVPQKHGLAELLAYLKRRRYKTVVATSTEAARTHDYLEKTGLRPFFDSIVCGDSVANRKPAPDIYLKACESIRIDPGECVALEDSPIGILAAHRAGMLPVMIPDLIQPDEATKKLLYAQLSSLADVIGLLEHARNA